MLEVVWTHGAGSTPESVCSESSFSNILQNSKKKKKKKSSWPGCARSQRGYLEWEKLSYDHEPSAAFWSVELWFCVLLAIVVSGFAPPAPA